MVSQKYKLFYFETGNFAREIAEINSRIKNIVDSGDLIPEKDMTKYVCDYLEAEVTDFRNILFDGYPRFTGQYDDLNNYLATKGSRIDFTFLLDVADDVLIKRLSARRTCEKCGKVYNLITNPPSGETCDCGGVLIQREDDLPGPISERLRVYKENVGPLVNYLIEAGEIIVIDGERSIDDISADIISHIEEVNK